MMKINLFFKWQNLIKLGLILINSISFSFLNNKLEAAYTSDANLNLLKSSLQILANTINGLENVKADKTSGPKGNATKNNDNLFTYKIKDNNHNEIIINLIKADILSVKADAIVNAANEECLRGGGIDGYITGKGGPSLAQARQNLPVVSIDKYGNEIRCPLTEARITRAGDLNYKDPQSDNTEKFKYVLHAVGPTCASTTKMSVIEKSNLANTYSNTINRALAFNENNKDENFPEFALVDISDLGDDYKITSMSFPAISTGIFHCSTKLSAEIVIQVVLWRTIMKHNMGALKTINFVFYDPQNSQKAADDFNNYQEAIENFDPSKYSWLDT